MPKKIVRKIHPLEKKLAAKIRSARMVKALSQDQVFEQMRRLKLIGTRRVVSEWESGHRVVTAVELFYLARVLGIKELAWFFK
jgi:transcriptional regulator with XRE-family HTH domain